ncbi:MAG: GDPmannose 4,6-dehydratase, partial [Gaiellaceae bacterium]|nr:GDPmannose 4,6-dehydratase [Gaiellaceae bacterium]
MDVRPGPALSAARAIVTGAGGQDGSYLAELLLDRGYEVVGLVRDSARDYPNLASGRDRVQLVQADMLDREALTAVLREHEP